MDAFKDFLKQQFDSGLTLDEVVDKLDDALDEIEKEKTKAEINPYTLGSAGIMDQLTAAANNRATLADGVDIILTIIVQNYPELAEDITPDTAKTIVEAFNEMFAQLSKLNKVLKDDSISDSEKLGNIIGQLAALGQKGSDDKAKAVAKIPLDKKGSLTGTINNLDSDAIMKFISSL